MQRGSRCNEDQDATRIKMHFLNLSQFFSFPQFFNGMKNNEEESFLSSVKCRIRTVYYSLVLLWESKSPSTSCLHRPRPLMRRTNRPLRKTTALVPRRNQLTMTLLHVSVFVFCILYFYFIYFIKFLLKVTIIMTLFIAEAKAAAEKAQASK